MRQHAIKSTHLTALTLLCAVASPLFAADAPAEQAPANVLAPFKTQTLVRAGAKHMNCHQRPGDGPPLVLIPGTWGDLRRFIPLIAELPKNLPIVVIELPWQGGHVPPTTDLTIEELADDVLWAIDTLKLSRFYVGGHSIGGMITVEIAGRDVPGLIGAVPIEGWTHHTVVHTAFAGQVVGKLTPEQDTQRQADRARGRAHLSDSQCNAIATIWRRWNGFRALQRAKVPILHVWGDRGKPRPDRKALQIPDRPAIQIAWIPNASHLIMLEAPKPLAKALLAFIQKNH